MKMNAGKGESYEVKVYMGQKDNFEHPDRIE